MRLQLSPPPPMNLQGPGGQGQGPPGTLDRGRGNTGELPALSPVLAQCRGQRTGPGHTGSPGLVLTSEHLPCLGICSIFKASLGLFPPSWTG